MNVETTRAKIEAFNVGSPLATEVSFEGGELWIRADAVTSPAQAWQSKDLHNWGQNELIIAPLIGQGAVFCYTQEDQRAGTATSMVVNRYLQELHLNTDVMAIPWHDRIATKIAVDRGSPSITLSTPDCEPRFRYVDLSEFVGSAVHAVFHMMKQIDHESITNIRCSRNDPRPYPETT